MPVYVSAPQEEAPWQPGAASRWWLHHSLERLSEDLAAIGLRLVLRRGSTLEELRDILRATGARTLFFNRLHEPAIAARDRSVAGSLEREGVRIVSFSGHLLYEPGSILNNAGRPFRVFTPFWRRCLVEGVPAPPIARLPRLRRPGWNLPSLSLGDLKLLPEVDWAAGLRKEWTPGERGARRRLRSFLARAEGETLSRDVPSEPGTSRLSPHLHFGEISVRAVWSELESLGSSAEPFLRQLGWREFSAHLLHHFPRTDLEPLDETFRRFRWRKDRGGFEAWCRGRTGYPLVDAGMRELGRTGWMHNRVRMIAASFLTKDLLVPWQEGARWFWETLVDADLANNTMGWQWTAGCGADAAPFFRIFNPVAQGKRWDPQGEYVRRWVPELGRIPPRWIHEPWKAPSEDPEDSAERAYPSCIVDHDRARRRALALYHGRSRKSSVAR